MLTLKSDNRVLTQNSPYSFLVDNYSAGVSSVALVGTNDFAADDFILIGEWGQGTAEIFRIGAITASTGTITLLTAAGASTTLQFAHPESTKVYRLQYNQIRFYWTAAAGTIADETPTFSTSTALTDWTALEPSGFYSTYDDGSNSTGFGWFVYRNSVTVVSSQNSNPIPYAGFSQNTVQSVFEDFNSLLNVNELKLVSNVERFAWLNEALAVLKNKLNLTNVEYTVSTTQTITIVSGTAEYQLPDDFADIVEITDGLNTSTTTGLKIPFKPVSQALSYTGDTIYHYLRGRYIGFVPTPAASATYYYRYRAKASRVSSLSTYIDLPDSAFFALKDWMMYRAYQKFTNPMSKQFYESFSNSVNLYMQSAVKRNANLDSFEIAESANV